MEGQYITELLEIISNQLTEINQKLSAPTVAAAELVTSGPQIVYTIGLGTAQEVMQAPADVFHPDFIAKFAEDFKQIANVRKKADNQTPTAQA